MKKQNKVQPLIWENDACAYDFEEVKAGILERRNDSRPEGYKLLPCDISEGDVWEEIAWLIEMSRDDEQALIDKELNNKVIAISNSFWNDAEYKVLGGNLNSIFDALECENQRLYCTQHNVCGKDNGTRYTFREVKAGVDAEELIEKYEDGKISASTIYKKYTRSLRPYIRKIYGC